MHTVSLSSKRFRKIASGEYKHHDVASIEKTFEKSLRNTFLRPILEKMKYEYIIAVSRKIIFKNKDFLENTLEKNFDYEFKLELEQCEGCNNMCISCPDFKPAIDMFKETMIKPKVR